jgi:hypothetical protein
VLPELGCGLLQVMRVMRTDRLDDIAAYGTQRHILGRQG